MLDLSLLRRLQTEQGEAALQEAAGLAPREADFLPTSQRLARRFPEDLARAAVEQAILRDRARSKFSQSSKLYFLREALEQATAEIVAAHRARRFDGASCIYDLGCGIGGDALTLARVGRVIAVDRDELRLAVLSANARALNLQASIGAVRADVLLPAWRRDPRALAFADPSRRRAGRRSRSGRAGDPALRELLTLTGYAGWGVKLSPAVDREEVAGLGEVEFISLDGELKECTLWLGRLASGARRATVLPGMDSLVGDVEPEIETGPIEAFLYQPDPAVLRASLVRTLAGQLGLKLVDTGLSLLTSAGPIDTPFARRYRVDEVLPFGLKRLREALLARGVGRVTIKKRGSPVEIEDFQRRLRLEGPEEATVVLTKAQGRRVMVIVARDREGIGEEGGA
jgi:hypothetical protein